MKIAQQKSLTLFMSCEPKAKVDVDVKAKTVTVVSGASEESIKQVIVASGYHIEGYQ